jgi:hypothetical protein
MDKKPVSKSDKTREAHLDKLLDEALKDTFPASDPIAINFEEGSTGETAKITKAGSDPHAE